MIEVTAHYIIPALLVSLILFFIHCVYSHAKEVKNGWRREDDIWDGDDDL